MTHHADHPPGTPGDPTDRTRGPAIAAVVIAVIALILGGVAIWVAVSDDDPIEEVLGSPEPTAEATDTPSPEATVRVDDTLPPGWTSCTNESVGYVIGYPEEWHTASTQPDNACRWFDRESFTLEEGTEGPVTDMMLVADGTPFQEVVDGFVTGDRVVSREDTEVNGRQAVVLEVVEDDDDGFYPEGTRTYAYVIDRDGEGFVVHTVGIPDADDFRSNTDIIDEAVETLRFPS